MSNLFRAIQIMKRSLGTSPALGRRDRPGGEMADDLLHVNPRDTDAQLSDWFDPHIVAVDPNSAPTGQLMVFLAGSHGHPGRQISIVRAAAAAGHLVINLTYPNSWTVGGLARKSSDPQAHEKLRRQIVEGTRSSDLVSIPPADSIINRLVKLLQWLDGFQPGANWSEFLVSDKPAWKKIQVVGHSQGGGHAAFIGKHYETAKVVMLGSPADFSMITRKPASWLQGESATPANRYFGFCHRRDPAFDRVLQAWALLGMSSFGSLVDIDSEPSPYRNSHSLVTNMQIDGEKFHGSVATDAAAPTSREGQIALASVWDYLFRE